jgi:hypothetical protein
MSDVDFNTEFKQRSVVQCFISVRREFCVSFEHSIFTRSVPTMEGEGGDPLSVNKNPRIIKGNF